MKLSEYFSRMQRVFCILACSALLFLVGLVDFLTGEEISLSVFYLIPVSLATWRTNGWIGILFSLLSAAVWFGSDAMTGHSYSNVAIAYWNAFVRLSFLIAVSTLLTKLKTSFLHEKELSRTDSLTGLLNMRAFYDLAYVELKRSQRYNRPLTAAYMDLDDFKLVNDRFGHEAGNTLLRSVADTLKSNVRANDHVARLGGDEFVLLLTETGGESARQALNKLQAQITMDFERNGWPVTLSIGVATFNRPPDSVDDLLKKADVLMYSAKNSGKDKIIYETVD